MFELTHRRFNYTITTKQIQFTSYFIQKRLSKTKTQGPKTVPRFSVADIRISSLFEQNAIFLPGKIDFFTLSPTISSSFAIDFNPYNDQNPLGNCCINRSGYLFSKQVILFNVQTLSKMYRIKLHTGQDGPHGRSLSRFP